MIIKVLLILGFAGAAVYALRGGGSSTTLAVRRMGGILFTVAAAVSVLFPDAVTWLANLVGVKEGSNLLLYGLVLAFMFVSIGLHQRIHTLEAHLATLTRELALRERQARR